MTAELESLQSYHCLISVTLQGKLICTTRISSGEGLLFLSSLPAVPILLESLNDILIQEPINLSS